MQSKICDPLLCMSFVYKLIDKTASKDTKEATPVGTICFCKEINNCQCEPYPLYHK